jgi:hypothetical protein
MSGFQWNATKILAKNLLIFKWFIIYVSLSLFVIPMISLIAVLITTGQENLSLSTHPVPNGINYGVTYFFHSTRQKLSHVIGVSHPAISELFYTLCIIPNVI